MKKKIQGMTTSLPCTSSASAASAKAVTGPSLYELVYLQQVAEELEAFLQSRSISTINKINFSFQGPGYQAQLLMSKGA